MPEAPTTGRKRAARAASGGATTTRPRKPQAIRQRPAPESAPSAAPLSAPTADPGLPADLTSAAHAAVDRFTEQRSHVFVDDASRDLDDEHPSAPAVTDSFAQRLTEALAAISHAQARSQTLLSEERSEPASGLADHVSGEADGLLPAVNEPRADGNATIREALTPSVPDAFAAAASSGPGVRTQVASDAPAVRPIANAPRAAAAYGQVHAPAAAQTAITPDEFPSLRASARDEQSSRASATAEAVTTADVSITPDEFAPSGASARDAARAEGIQPGDAGSRDNGAANRAERAPDPASARSPRASARDAASAERTHGAGDADGAERTRGAADAASAERIEAIGGAADRGLGVAASAARQGGLGAERHDAGANGGGVGARWSAWLAALDRMPPIRLPIGPPIPWRLGLPLLLTLLAAVTLVGRSSGPSSADAGKVRLPTQEIYAVQADGPLFAASSSGDGQPQASTDPADPTTATTTSPTGTTNGQAGAAAVTSARAAAQTQQAIGVAEPAAMNVDILDIGLKLAAVLGLAYGSLVLLKKAGLGGGGRASLPGAHTSDGLKVLSTVALAPNRTVHTLRLPDGRTLVIGATPNSVNLLTELTDLDDVDDTDAVASASSLPSVLDGLRAHLR